MAAEEDDGRRQIGAQAHFFSQLQGIGIVGEVEVGSQNHPRREEDVRVVVAHSAGLLSGLFGASDDVLLLDRLDPKAGWEIGEVRDECDERAAGIDLGPTLANLTIEVRNDGNEQVRRMLPPEALQQSDQGAVKQPDGGLKDS